MEKLYEQVIEAVHGQVRVKTPFCEFDGIGPDAWIEKAFDGQQVTGWQILAIILFCFGIPARPISKTDEITLFYKWKVEIDAAIRSGLIKPYDPVTLLRLKSKPKDYNWIVPVEAADIFMDSVGHDTKVSYLLEKLHKEYLERINGNTVSTAPLEKEVTPEADIDPSDLPHELSAANIAFRAVTNGHGDPTATFKNRLIHYLENNFPGLNNEAVQRIATVANPDKAPGRKKRSAE